MNSISSRISAAYRVVRNTFGVYVTPVLSVGLFAALRTSVAIGMALDNVFFPKLKNADPSRPIVLVGNPRTGTTFLQRFLADQGFGAGLQLWRMLYPSLTLQLFLKPILPILEVISPARHHSTVAHKTSLSSVETDDVGVLFRYFDGFFLYGFFLAFDDDDHLDAFAPENRNTNDRDFAWLRELWRRNLVAQNADRHVGKLFSLSTRLPAFLDAFPEAHILYMARDPVSVIPSGMSLVTGVLDKRFGFWTLPEDVRNRYLERLYAAFVELQRRFTEDWTSGKIDQERVYIVRYDRMMKDFDSMMAEVMDHIGHDVTDAQQQAITERAEKQRAYVSKHKYDLDKFGLSQDQIRKDCAFYYDTFLPPIDLEGAPGSRG